MAVRLQLNRDFKEFVALLNKNKVRYLVVGGYAVAAHGRPRYTKDIDIWLDVGLDNAEKVVAALEEFGFGSMGLTPTDFLKPGRVVRLGRPPYQIELLTRISGVEFDDCYSRKIVVKSGRVPLDFISLDDLRKNKKSSGRPQDLADLDALG